MLEFDIVRKIGNGNYLNEDSFIIERVRKGRALRLQGSNLNGIRTKAKVFFKHEKSSQA